jgi:hypothetical protein
MTKHRFVPEKKIAFGENEKISFEKRLNQQYMERKRPETETASIRIKQQNF